MSPGWNPEQGHIVSVIVCLFPRRRTCVSQGRDDITQRLWNCFLALKSDLVKNRKSLVLKPDRDKRITNRISVLGEKYFPSLLKKKSPWLQVWCSRRSTANSLELLISALWFSQLLLGSWAHKWRAEWQTTVMTPSMSSTRWSPLLSLGTPEWEMWRSLVAFWPGGSLSGHLSLFSEAHSREYGAKWLRRKGNDLATVLCQLVESDDTLRTIFFGIMSSLQPFYNHTVSLSTSAYLPGSSPIATTG